MTAGDTHRLELLAAEAEKAATHLAQAVTQASITLASVTAQLGSLAAAVPGGAQSSSQSLGSQAPAAPAAGPHRVLLIVDVQLGLRTAHDPAYIRGLANAAVTYPGRVVTICGDGLSIAPQDMLPPGTPVLWKDRNDGGNEVYAWLVGAGLVQPGLVVEVCGMNTNACVLDTATGLGERLKNKTGLIGCVRIVLSLCRDDNGTVGFVQELLP